MWVRKKDIPEIADMYSDLWELTKDFWIIEDKEEYWDALIAKAKEKSEKYKDPLAKRMFVALVDYFGDQKKEHVDQFDIVKGLFTQIGQTELAKDFYNVMKRNGKCLKEDIWTTAR